MPISYYCRQCRAYRLTFEEWAGEWKDRRLRVRCQACGEVVETGVPEGDHITFYPQRILFIDDDELERRMFLTAMEAAGLNARVAADGHAGLKIAATETPDLVLVDVMMPELDGYEVCRRMRELPRMAAVPIILFTAMADPKLKVKGSQVGADLAMRKTFDPQKLRSIFETIVWLKASQVGGGEPRRNPG